MELTVCKNPWCKGHFEAKLINGEYPKVCDKCRSFDTELSGGVSWSTKEYERDIEPEGPQRIVYKVNKYI